MTSLQKTTSYVTTFNLSDTPVTLTTWADDKVLNSDYGQLGIHEYFVERCLVTPSPTEQFGYQNATFFREDELMLYLGRTLRNVLTVRVTVYGTNGTTRQYLPAINYELQLSVLEPYVKKYNAERLTRQEATRRAQQELNYVPGQIAKRRFSEWHGYRPYNRAHALRKAYRHLEQDTGVITGRFGTLGVGADGYHLTLAEE